MFSPASVLYEQEISEAEDYAALEKLKREHLPKEVEGDSNTVNENGNQKNDGKA